MTASLVSLKRAARAKARADARYRAELLAAHAAGVSYAEIAHALGVSRQAVRQLVERAPSGGQAAVSPGRPAPHC